VFLFSCFNSLQMHASSCLQKAYSTIRDTTPTYKKKKRLFFKWVLCYFAYSLVLVSFTVGCVVAESIALLNYMFSSLNIHRITKKRFQIKDAGLNNTCVSQYIAHNTDLIRIYCFHLKQFSLLCIFKDIYWKYVTNQYSMIKLFLQ
jgi:hypothetical protein